MTSSANSVVFFTTFQCGMSPSVRLRFTRLLPASSIQPADGVGHLFGVPATMRLMAMRSSQFDRPVHVGGLDPLAELGHRRRTRAG